MDDSTKMPAAEPEAETKTTATTAESVFTRTCISCKPPDLDELRRTVHEDELCKVVLRTDNQCWLGRYIVVPKAHLDPIVFWESSLVPHIMKVHVRCSHAVMRAFGAVCVQMAQLGGLTVDHENQPTTDQRYQHAHIHGIPRYAENVPQFAGKSWPDPQFRNGKFAALNIDPQCGLPKVVPSADEVTHIVAAIRSKMCEC